VHHDAATLSQRCDWIVDVFEGVRVNDQIPLLVSKGQVLHVNVGILDQLVIGQLLKPGREVAGLVDLENS
jgi:hypothetical protein